MSVVLSSSFTGWMLFLLPSASFVALKGNPSTDAVHGKSQMGQDESLLIRDLTPEERERKDTTPFRENHVGH